MPSANTIGLWRRFGCITYDLLALIAIWWAVSLPFAALDPSAPGSPERLLYQAYLSLVGLAYFVLCWRARGATVGMRAWRVRIETVDGQRIGWGAAVIRGLGAILSSACLGLGFLWSLFGAARLCWHDQWSATRLVSAE